MQEAILITDPRWATTFPHIVAPLENEWLVGLLLRVDHFNGWNSGTTLSSLLRSGKKRGIKFLSDEHYEGLALRLALAPASILATTYQGELARLNEPGSESTISLSLPPFHLCPLCVSSAHLLTRALALPGITSCPTHHVLFVDRCSCGQLLHPFHDAQPFHCHACGLSWGELPSAPADSMQKETERTLLAIYDFFFLQGSSRHVTAAQHLLSEQAGPAKRKQRRSSLQIPLHLETLVTELLAQKRSPQDILLHTIPPGQGQVIPPNPLLRSDTKE
jgi:hypothetical protein